MSRVIGDDVAALELDPLPVCKGQHRAPQLRCHPIIGKTRIVEVADAPSALAVLQTQAPDLMMVDFAMPGMNGAELAKAARTLRPELPIVFATGYADTAAIEDALGKNAAVLRKPFRVEHLQAVIAEALASTAG